MKPMSMRATIPTISQVRSLMGTVATYVAVTWCVRESCKTVSLTRLVSSTSLPNFISHSEDLPTSPGSTI
jgi:hypothetical protein